MEASLRLGPPRFLLTLCSALLITLPSRAQINTSGSRNCTDADFDTNVQFFNGPDSFSVVVHKRNIANHVCVFDGPEYGPSIVPDRVEGEKPFGLCYFCDDRLANGMTRTHPPITVPPGDVALQTFRWKTKPENDSAHCVPLKWKAGPILLVTPSLLKPVCSSIDVSPFTIETTSGSSLPNTQPGPAPPVFELTAERDRYSAGESFSLKLAPIPGSQAVTPDRSHCPTFYMRHRSPDGATRIDEVQPITSVGCKTFIPGRRPINSESTFEIDSGANSHWQGAGEHTSEVLQLVGSADDAQVRFVASNILRVEIADPAAMTRKWEPESERHRRRRDARQGHVPPWRGHSAAHGGRGLRRSGSDLYLGSAMGSLYDGWR